MARIRILCASNRIDGPVGAQVQVDNTLYRLRIAYNIDV
jgi:hypothetical protein